MTIYQRTGIAIVALPSIFQPGSEIGSYTEQVAAYSHQLDADGGYRRASLTLTLSVQDCEAWFEDGLMRDITAYNAVGQVIFNGFANKVSLNIGGLQLTRGPVLDAVNRLSATYTRLDTSVSPPVSGGESVTTIAEDAASQALYGVLETVISAGTCTDAEAEQLRDAYLAERRRPVVSQSYDLAGGSAPSVTLECAGYIEYLSRFTYDNPSTLTTTITAKLLAVLAARPNSIISTNYLEVDANPYLVPAGDEKALPGMDVIRGLVALGDASENRWTFGIWAGRKARYQAAPTTFAYQAALGESRVALYGGGAVDPWDVAPGQWLFYNDLLVGRGAPASDLRQDPRAQFIESATFTAPVGLQLAGGRTDKLTQKLAQYGLGGA